jgi:type II secretory ATPase GspE/PulE/Tfp pilus assembly ATPase PilB-like protein/DNA-binding NarL/FixJ family response regulator
VLFVDDEPNVLRAMQRIFRQEHYQLVTAASGQEALALLEQEAVHVVISDYRMPGMNGVDLLRHIKAQHPQTIRIMLTGNADVHAIMGAVNEGAVYKFITKPWNDDDLRLTVSLALEQYDLIHENLSLKKQTSAQKQKIKKLSRFAKIRRSQLGTYLLDERLITQEDLDRVQAMQAKEGKLLATGLLEANLIDETTLLQTIQKKLKLHRVYPNEFAVPTELVALIPEEICRQNLVVPLKRLGSKLIVAMADPTDYVMVDELSFIAGMSIETALATPQEITAKLNDIYGASDVLDNALSKVELTDPTETIEIIIDEDEDDTPLEDLLNRDDRPPAIRIVNAIIADALRHNASDVHIEPKTKYTMVRYRIDDLLQDKIHVPLSMHPAIVSRIKILSELDITERRRPQDGRVTVKTSSRMVDMRISTLPTINGEKVVLRVLDKNAAIRDLHTLGLCDKDLDMVSHLIKYPQGIVLTTGPTGSGKTSTLYALLRHGATITKNFTTIEDPVEFQMDMAEQVSIREKIGLDFSKVLRSILRQDPNVIMLGEIRDKESAETAFHAAMTGHLVLSTLHTNSSFGTITRLRDIGIKSYVISDALLGVVAQRLVRRICEHCRAADDPPEHVWRQLGLSRGQFQPQKGTGCESCNHQGYKGRTGVYEILQIDSEIRKMIHREATETELIRYAKIIGMQTLFEDAIRKMSAGITTCEEVLRVFGPQTLTEIQCQHCHTTLEERFEYCPYCGQGLLRQCRYCKKFLIDGWHFCPFCSTHVRA